MKVCLFIIGIFISQSITAQELFVINEPASTVPKGVLGLKLMSETYNESGAIRNQFAARIMYGLTSNLTLWAQPMVSNHHGQTLPADLITHRHVGANTISYTRTIKYGSKYNYSFAGIHFYGKFRILNFDQDNQHLRIALVGEYTPLGQQAHDEAEPHLQGDTGGLGGGAIITYLKNRFAVSFTGGYIMPQAYEDVTSNNRYKIDYGNAINYSLSFGYLLYPKKYDSYQQNNYNIYLELSGKSFEQAHLSQRGNDIDIQSEALMAGQYLDAYIGVQRIVNSNDRIELSIGFPVINKSYRHFYPLLNLAWQKYFYFK